MIDSSILELRWNDSFDIVTSMGIPTSSIYMSHIYCVSPIDGNNINTKPKPTMPQPQKHHLYIANPMMSIGHTLSSYPHTSGGNLLTQKSPTHLSMAYTTQGHHLTTLISLYKTLHDLPFDPHTSKRAQGWRKGIKTPKRSPKYPPRS